MFYLIAIRMHTIHHLLVHVHWLNLVFHIMQSLRSSHIPATSFLRAVKRLLLRAMRMFVLPYRDVTVDSPVDGGDVVG